MKNKYFIFIISLFLFAYAYIPSSVFAGGCCFQYFESTNGIAGTKEASISVAFVDPRSYIYPHGPYPLANEKIEINIEDAAFGQYCKTESEKTDNEGAIKASCYSIIPGSIHIFFSAPNLEKQYNDSIRYPKREIIFDPMENVIKYPAVMINVLPTIPVLLPIKEEDIIKISLTPDYKQIDSSNENTQRMVKQLEENIANQRKQISDKVMFFQQMKKSLERMLK